MVYVNRIYAEEKFNDGQYQHEGLQFRLQKLLVRPLITGRAKYVAGSVPKQSLKGPVSGVTF